MSFFEIYNFTIIKYDLVNTFAYQDLTQMPSLKKIILNFGYPKSKLKNLNNTVRNSINMITDPNFH